MIPGAAPLAPTVSLRFQIGARTLASVPRRLRRIELSLDDALGHRVPVLAPLGEGEQGYLITSLPEGATLDRPDLLVHRRQRYRRWFVDLAAGEAAWWSGLSANARAQARRKEKRVAAAGGEVRAYRDAGEIAAFHPLARAVSARTYQERLLDAGLPTDPAALIARAAAGEVRAWLLFVGGAAVAYLCCTGEGSTLRYDHVGHDPAARDLAPGSVLQAAALRDLFAEARWARFDFTPGEGQHKRQLATGGIACVDLLLLRPTAANRALLIALRGWDGAVAWAKRRAPGLRRLGR